MMHSHTHNINKRFLLGVFLNLAFIIVEFVFGIKSNSVALLADAMHNAGDVLGLLVAWFGYLLAQKKAPSKFTYGFKNATIIAAFINAILLFVAVGGISWEAFQRLGQQQSIASETIIIVATFGVFINGLTAYFFFQDRHNDINIKGVFLHMLLDAAVSVGVIVGGLLIFWKSWTWIDPVLSLLIAGIIMIGSWKLFKESLDLMFLAVPTAINLEKLKEAICQYPGLVAYHDLHIWPLSTTEIALSVHLEVTPELFTETFSYNLEKILKTNFPLSHITIQLETSTKNEKCETNCL